MKVYKKLKWQRLLATEKQPRPFQRSLVTAIKRQVWLVSLSLMFLLVACASPMSEKEAFLKTGLNESEGVGAVKNSGEPTASADPAAEKNDSDRLLSPSSVEPGTELTNSDQPDTALSTSDGTTGADAPSQTAVPARTAPLAPGGLAASSPGLVAFLSGGKTTTPATPDPNPFAQDLSLGVLRALADTADRPIDLLLSETDLAPGDEKENRQPVEVGLPAGAADQAYVALTFDDGPSSTQTPRVLDILKKYNIKAVFCLVGKRIQGQEEIVKRMVDEGHLLCNHSWDHRRFTDLTKEEVEADIKRTEAALHAATGYSSAFFRPPYGSYDESILATVPRPFLMWSVDTLDWKSKNTKDILAETQQSLHPGAIILLHDIHETTVDALEPLIQHIQQQGYSFIRADRLLTADGQPLQDGQTYSQQP